MRPVISLIALFVSMAAAAAPMPTPLDKKLAGLMDELEKQRLEHHVPGLAIAVVVDDEVVLARGLGLADIEQGRPATPRTVFAIGSSTKAFTSALAAISVEKRELDWDEPLSWYLPEFQPKPDSEDAKASITFRDALSHRSGFARMGALWAGGSATPEQVYLTASGAEPVAPFRESFNYNNVVYTAAGDAVARAAGRPWDVLMRKRLLKPLGMKNATLLIEDAAKDKNLAVGYAWDDDEEDFLSLPMRDIHLVAPAGAINATVLDVAQWVRFQLARGVIDGKRLISAEALEETWRPQIDIAEQSAYGLGWMVHERNGRRVVEHGGNIDGFAAQVTLYPDDGLGYVLLMNTTASALQQVSVATVASALLDEDEAAPAGDGELDLASFPGDYIANFASFKDAAFAVSVVDEKLHVNVPGQMNFELKRPDEEGKWYFALTEQVAVSFDRDGAGQVVAMKMYQNGLTFELPRSGFEPDLASIEIPDEWKKYFGQYRSPSLNANVTVLTQNGKLALDVPGQMVFELKPGDDGRWTFLVSEALQVAFESDEKGQIGSVTQYRGGAPVEVWERVGDAPQAAASGDLAMVRELVQADKRGKAIAELGGIRMVGKVRVHSSGLNGTIELLAEGTDRFRHEVDQSPFVTSVSIVNGDQASVESNVQENPHLSAALRRQMQLDHPLSLFSDWNLFFDHASYDGPSQFGDRSTHVVKLEADELDPYLVHVDAETGDVLMVESKVASGRGLPSIPMKTVLSDHRDLGGLRVPYTIAVSNDHTGTTTISFDSMETGLDFPPATFSVH